VTRPFICHFLYHICDFNLVSPTYSVPSSGRASPSSGSNVVGEAQVAESQDTIEAQPSDEAISGGGVPVTGAVAATGATTHAATDSGSLAPKVLPRGATNVTAKEVATDDPASSAGPSGVRLPPPKRLTMMSPCSPRSSWGTPRLGPPRMSPSMRPCVWPAGRIPRPKTCSIERVVGSSMNDDACCSGLPCSWSAQWWRGQGRRLGSNTLT
jgi:hypothetical protein